MPRPYTYLLLNADKTSWYIGVRTKNVKLGLTAEQDVLYMSSSKYVKARIQAGEVFTKHILGEYETNEEACAAERALQEEFMDVLPGTINKTKNGGLTYTWDEETRAKLSAAIKAAFASPEARAKMSASAKAALARPEVKAKISASAKAAFARPEARAKLSAARKNMWQNPEYCAKFCKQCTVDGVTIYPSLKELIAELGKGKNGSKHPNFRYI